MILIRVILGLIIAAITCYTGGFLIYIGFYDCLIQSIVAIIDQCKAPTTNSSVIGWSVFLIFIFEIPVLIGICIIMFGLTEAFSIIFYD